MSGRESRESREHREFGLNLPCLTPDGLCDMMRRVEGFALRSGRRVRYAHTTWEPEIGSPFDPHQSINIPRVGSLDVHAPEDFFSPVALGSNRHQGMVTVPCSAFLPDGTCYPRMGRGGALIEVQSCVMNLLRKKLATEEPIDDRIQV